MRNPILIFALLLSGKLFSQIDSTIEKKFEQLRYSQEYLHLDYDFFYIKEDTIHITVKHNRKLTTTETYFKLSQRMLTVDFYYLKDSLFFITTSETCPTKPKLTCDSRYFIKENKIAQQDHSSSKAISLGVLRSLKEIQEEHFCPDRFDYDFLEKYIWRLLKTIKEKYPD